MAKYKITVVGAGNVGSVIANTISQRGYADVCIIDIEEGLAKGKALDMNQQCAIIGSDSKVFGGNDYRITEGSNISVITAGIPRKPGMKREDLIETNSKIVKGIIENLIKYSPNTYIIVVTNPVDTISYLALKVSGLSRNKVIGMGGILDTARFKYYIKEKTGYSYESINCFVLGGHGDEMVPVVSTTTVGGKYLKNLLSTEEIKEIVEKTKKGGAEIVNLLKTGSAYYAPGMAVVEMIESILFDKKKVLPCSVFCQGEYGIENIFFGLPVRLGKDGIEEIIEIPLSEEEKQLLEESAKSVKATHLILENLKII